MSRYYYLLETLSAVSISEKHNSDYNTACLDYIPGSVVSGALAAQLYSNPSFRDLTLDSENSSTKILDHLFQDNSAIFSNCLPLYKNKEENKLEVVLPAPSCLHYVKGEKEASNGYINRVAKKQGEEQLKQVRAGYMRANTNGATDSDALKFAITRRSVTKTAINRTTLTADEGRLYSVTYIPKNAVFWGYIDLKLPESNSEAQKVAEYVKKFLKSEIRIGKTRSSEFGRASLSLIPDDEAKEIDAWFDNSFKKANETKKLHLWCLSNVEFVNLKTGAPTLIPEFSNLWLPRDIEAHYVASESFIRTDAIRYFNRKRNGYDGSSFIIKRGSIITFEITDAQGLSDEELKSIVKNGIGFSRHRGMGQVLVNPEWIGDEKIQNSSNIFNPLFLNLNSKNADEVAEKDPHEYDALKAFIYEKDNDAKLNEELRKEAEELYSAIAALYISARSYDNSYSINSDDLLDYGPNSTQWGEFQNVIYPERKEVTEEKDNCDIEKDLNAPENATYRNKIEDLMKKNLSRDASMKTLGRRLYYKNHEGKEDFTDVGSALLDIILGYKVRLGAIRKFLDIRNSRRFSDVEDNPKKYQEYQFQKQTGSK